MSWGDRVEREEARRRERFAIEDLAATARYHATRVADGPLREWLLILAQQALAHSRSLRHRLMSSNHR